MSKTIDLKTISGRNRFYNSKEWRALRLVVLTETPFCVNCLKTGIKVLASECDHIIDIKDRPDLVFNKDNLQSLCKSCHSKKTVAEMETFGKTKVEYITVNRKWKEVKFFQ